LKYEEDQRVLRDGLLRDDLSCTATDRSFTTCHDKIAGQNVIDVRGGNSSAEIRIEVNYMEAVVRRKMSSEDYVAINSTNAAKLLGLYSFDGPSPYRTFADMPLECGCELIAGISVVRSERSCLPGVSCRLRQRHAGGAAFLLPCQLARTFHSRVQRALLLAFFAEP
jgi:hypothetical protein